MPQPTPANATVQRHELEEIFTRLDWVDEERRKAAKRMGELEQQVEQQTREIAGREQRLRDLEARLSNMISQVNRIAQLDVTLQQFKDELISLIEQYDNRRLAAAAESERMQRVEREMQAREIGDIRKELPEISRLRTDMELRQAEEARLAGLISKLQTRIPPLENRIETWERDLSYVRDRERQWAKNITDLESGQLEVRRRIEPLGSRLDLVENNLLRAENNIQELTGLQAEVRLSMKSWMDQIQLGEYERNQRLEKWQEVLNNNRTELERFKQEWVMVVEQNKQAQMTIDAVSEWQRQFEQQQKEAIEIMRVETGRMQSRWDNFLADHEKRWRNFQVEHEQRTADTQRRDKQLEEQIFELAGQIKQVEADKETLWRVQAANLDAVKQIPRIWLEEVEKARQRDPNRRRPPTLVQMDEEL
jgi:chromosome segregation ATPase